MTHLEQPQGAADHRQRSRVGHICLSSSSRHWGGFFILLFLFFYFLFYFLLTAFFNFIFTLFRFAELTSGTTARSSTGWTDPPLLWHKKHTHFSKEEFWFLIFLKTHLSYDMRNRSMPPQWHVLFFQKKNYDVWFKENSSYDMRNRSISQRRILII